MSINIQKESAGFPDSSFYCTINPVRLLKHIVYHNVAAVYGDLLVKIDRVEISTEEKGENLSPIS
jgi:hypothetical protein